MRLKQLGLEQIAVSFIFSVETREFAPAEDTIRQPRDDEPDSRHRSNPRQRPILEAGGCSRTRKAITGLIED